MNAREVFGVLVRLGGLALAAVGFLLTVRDGIGMVLAPVAFSLHDIIWQLEPGVIGLIFGLVMLIRAEFFVSLAYGRVNT